jgi:hypothetical protein
MIKRTYQEVVKSKEYIKEQIKELGENYFKTAYEELQLKSLKGVIL